MALQAGFGKEAVLKAIADERGGAVELHLLKDAGFMGADRFDRQVQAARNVTDSLTRDDATKDLQFSIGQPLVSRALIMVRQG
jgi:hypothetical protein